MRRTLLVCAAIALTPSLAMAQQRQLSVTTASPEALALYQKALDFVENVESESARPLLDQAIQKDPGFAMAYALRAVTGEGSNASRQNLEKALSFVEKVSPGERQWIMAAQAQADGDVPKMKQHLVELLKLHPNDQHVAYFAGNAARLTDDDRGAHASSSARRPSTRSSRRPTIRSATSRSGRATSPAAEQALKQYITNRPDSANPYDSYAELLLRMGRYDESIAQYEKALTKSPAFAGSLTGIGHNYVFKGDYAKARDELQASLRHGKCAGQGRQPVLDRGVLRPRRQAGRGAPGARTTTRVRDSGETHAYRHELRISTRPGCCRSPARRPTPGRTSTRSRR